ncbi:MAG: Clp1/GlmU family protein [Armatimonadota bacterium]|nr:Clp1/GlmU family protein [Armatimonadota bacterium]
MTPSPEWQACIQSIVQNPGLVVVIGSSDTGKTTFCAQLINAAVEAELKCALVDADIGQSEIGPPGVIGLGEANSPVERPSDIPIRRMYFAGTTSPVGNMLPSVVGAKKMADEAKTLGARLIVVDTTGFVRGVLARKLKTHKVHLLAPDHIVAIQRGHEIDSILGAFGKLEKCAVHNLKVSELARLKSPEMRASRRRVRFLKHFESAEEHVIRLDDVACWGTWLNTGRALTWQRVRRIEQILRIRILHAEATGQGYYVVVERMPQAENLADLRERVRARDVTVVPGSAFTYAYVGLADGRARLLDVGIVHAIDFRQRHVTVLTRLKTVAPVRLIQFGLMRVRPDGTELTKLRQGEI